jgi:hypothetical protein
MDFMAIRTYLIIAIILGALIFTSFYFLVISKIVLVLNPSFEKGVWGEDANPQYWTFHTGSSDDKVKWVNDVAHDGNKSIRVDFSGASWITIPHHYGTDGIRLIPSTEYEVSFYVRSMNMTKVCIGYDAHAEEDDSFVQWYSCPGGTISFPADGKWHKVTHRFNTNKLTENTYGVFKFDISGCDRNQPSSAPYCEGEPNSPGTMWIDGPVRISRV